MSQASIADAASSSISISDFVKSEITQAIQQKIPPKSMGLKCLLPPVMIVGKPYSNKKKEVEKPL